MHWQPKIYDLHIWFGDENPSGPFAMQNENIAKEYIDSPILPPGCLLPLPWFLRLRIPLKPNIHHQLIHTHHPKSVSL